MSTSSLTLHSRLSDSLSDSKSPNMPADLPNWTAGWNSRARGQSYETHQRFLFQQCRIDRLERASHISLHYLPAVNKHGLGRPATVPTRGRRASRTRRPRWSGKRASECFERSTSVRRRRSASGGSIGGSWSLLSKRRTFLAGGILF